MDTQRHLYAWAKATKDRAWLWGSGAFLLAGAVMWLVTSIVYGHDSTVATNLHATRLATVTAVVGFNFAYQYATPFRDDLAPVLIIRECRGNGTLNPPPALGTQVLIYYDPNDPCRSMPANPVALQQTDLGWLLGLSVVFSLAVGSAAWDYARQR